VGECWREQCGVLALVSARCVVAQESGEWQDCRSDESSERQTHRTLFGMARSELELTEEHRTVQERSEQ
jgi:hypothetical protein